MSIERLFLWIALTCLILAVVLYHARGADADLGGVLTDATFVEHTEGEWYATWESGEEETPPTAYTNLIAWWRIDYGEDTGAFVEDRYADQGGDNYMTNATVLRRGTVTTNGTLDLVNSGPNTEYDYMYGTNTTLLNGDSTWSITFWFNGDETSPYYCGLVCSRGSQLNGFTLYDVDEKIVFYVNSTSLIYTHGSGLVDEWHHVAGTYNGSSMYIYLDGVQVAGGGKSGAASVDDRWRLGLDDYDLSRALDGQLDDVRLYDRTLSSNECYLVHAEGRQ